MVYDHVTFILYTERKPPFPERSLSGTLWIQNSAGCLGRGRQNHQVRSFEATVVGYVGKETRCQPSGWKEKNTFLD